MLIGLTGSFGAGKGAVAEYLIHEKGFTHYSARALIIKEIEKRHLSINRDSMIEVANSLRQNGGSTYIFEQLVNEAKHTKGDAVVESVRTIAEANYIKANGGIVLGIDADPKIRYERSVRRGSETDHVTFEKWQEQEVCESNPDDPTKQDIFGALKKSDYIITNNGTRKALYTQVNVFLKQFTT